MKKQSLNCKSEKVEIKTCDALNTVFVTSNTLYDSQKALELIFVSNYLVFSITPICWLRSISSISCFCSVFSRPTICLMKTCWRRSNTLGLSSKSFIRHLKGTQAKYRRICAKMFKIPHQMATDKNQIQENTNKIKVVEMNSVTNNVLVKQQEDN